MLEALKIKAGDSVDVSVEDSLLVIRPLHERPKYMLDELLEKCVFEATSNRELMEWERIAPLDREISDRNGEGIALIVP